MISDLNEKMNRIENRLPTHARVVKIRLLANEEAGVGRRLFGCFVQHPTQPKGTAYLLYVCFFIFFEAFVFFA